MKEWNESLLDKELESLMEELPEQQDLDKKIEEGIQKKIRKTVVRTVSMIMAGIITLFLIINPIMNAAFLNPAKLNDELNENGASTLLCVLRDYWETLQPYSEIISVDVEKNGFSRYELSMQVANHRDHLYIGVTNVWCEMALGNYKNWKDSNMLLIKNLGRFSAAWTNKDEYIAQIKELPQSAMIYLSVGAMEARTVEDLQKEAVDLEWIQIYQPNVEFQGGISLRMVGAIDETDRRDSLTPQELKDVYLSNLENLLANIEVWEPFGLYSVDTIYMQVENVLRETYEDAKTLDVLESKNYCISGKRDTIVEYLEKTETASILVDDVKLSSLK